MVRSFEPESTTIISSAHFTVSRVRGRLCSSFIAIMATERVQGICEKDKRARVYNEVRGNTMKVVIFGATGMVGRGVLLECLRDPDVELAVTVGRTPTGIHDAKVQEI